MSSQTPEFPQVGDIAPDFEFESRQGRVSLSQYTQGHWCVFFAHPANFTSAWAMFSTFLGMKERRLNSRNIKVLGLSNEPLRHSNDWAEKARRYVGIYLRAPVIEDLDFRIARMYGLASGRRPQPGCDRLAVVIDPGGIVRMVIHRPLPDIDSALLEIERALDRLQGIQSNEKPATPKDPMVSEQADAAPRSTYRLRAAYFSRKKLVEN